MQNATPQNATPPNPEAVEWDLDDEYREKLQTVVRNERGTARAFVAARMLAGLAFWCPNCHANAALWRAEHPGENLWDHRGGDFSDQPDPNNCPADIILGGCGDVCMPQGTCDHMKDASGEYLN